MSLQTQYRPASFKNLVGNEDIKYGLIPVLKRKVPPAAFLFTGPAGTGKTTIARIIKRALHCDDMDWKELNAADDRGIDETRELIKSMRFKPLVPGGNKVYLLDEAHMLTKPAQEALLKSLEEPPDYVHWVICTTNPETLKSTLKRRCHIYELEPLKSSEIQKLFRMVLKKEDRECVSMDVRDKIIELADGSAGVALKLLDQVIDMDDAARAINALKGIGTSDAEVLEICRTLTHYNMPPKTKWIKVKKLIKDLKGDGEAARRPILGYMNAIMLNNGGDDIFFIMKPFANNFFDSGKAGLTMACYEAIFGGE